jgi:hypothetical protein
MFAMSFDETALIVGRSPPRHGNSRAGAPAGAGSRQHPNADLASQRDVVDAFLTMDIVADAMQLRELDLGILDER